MSFIPSGLRLRSRAVLALVALLVCGAATAQEAVIRKNLAERLPTLPKIDEVTRTPIPGLFEVRFGGTEILYTDATGDHVLAGAALIETKTRTDLTEARINKLLEIDFDKLPIKDAVVFKQGTGARKLAIFADPNCGFCKRFERDIAGLKDVTVYTFVVPILGADSATKSRDVWCARDAPRAWRAWMLDNVPPPRSAASCDSAAIDRNLEFSKKNRINGTPVTLFEDGSRKVGALPVDAIEKLMAAAAKKN
jgi:thiol:disulfide interchange protein DsbC